VDAISNLAASGYGSKLAASGYKSKLAASGNYSRLAATGKNNIVVSSGKGTVVTAVKGTWVSLAEYDEDGNCIGFASGKIPKKGTYAAKNGKLVEVSK